ncbi:hypothetical protein PWE35_09215 [Stenotrophomonas maltophilia]|uniref:hypothetical protein n=1 Tax=Stenotrophomonas maltophilia TaxID=40324 RepID=UPI00237F43D5|nr:hypothetical protein [Stenotrophomonas maltophilia]WDW06002.1 hypothetical protein PWE35_09215 [Stenotrophomonas maltophilia]
MGLHTANDLARNAQRSYDARLPDDSERWGAITDVANECIEEERVGEMVQALVDALPILSKLSRIPGLSPAGAMSGMALLKLALRLDKKIEEQARLFSDARNS